MFLFFKAASYCRAVPSSQQTQEAGLQAPPPSWTFMAPHTSCLQQSLAGSSWQEVSGPAVVKPCCPSELREQVHVEGGVRVPVPSSRPDLLCCSVVSPCCPCSICPACHGAPSWQGLLCGLLAESLTSQPHHHPDGRPGTSSEAAGTFGRAVKTSLSWAGPCRLPGVTGPRGPPSPQAHAG